MRCLGCSKEHTAGSLRLFKSLMLCSTCYEMAEKAGRDLERMIHQARETASAWLLEHIMRGGLYAAGSGVRTPLSITVKEEP